MRGGCCEVPQVGGSGGALASTMHPPLFLHRTHLCTNQQHDSLVSPQHLHRPSEPPSAAIWHLHGPIAAVRIRPLTCFHSQRRYTEPPVDQIEAPHPSPPDLLTTTDGMYVLHYTSAISSTHQGGFDAVCAPSTAQRCLAALAPGDDDVPTASPAPNHSRIRT